MRLVAITVLAIAVVPSWSTAAVAAPPSPATVRVDLEALGGSSRPADSNDSGVIVGTAEQGLGGQTRAVRWDAGGRIHLLPTLGGDQPYGAAFVVNAAGTIGGELETPSPSHAVHAVRWDPSGQVTDLGPLPGELYSTLLDLNDAGVAVGESISDKGGETAVRWDPAGRIAALDGPPDTALSGAAGVNAAGVAVGHVDTAGGDRRAARWDASGRVTVLPSLPSHWVEATAVNRTGTAIGGALVDRPQQQQVSRALAWNPRGRLTVLPPLPGDVQTLAQAISDDGTIVGISSDGASHYHAVRWNRAGRVTRLGTLPDGQFGAAEGINARGTVVGTSTRADGTTHAVAWRPCGDVIDLGYVGGFSAVPTGITARGQVIGTAETVPGQLRAVLWPGPVR
jgi:probable HAF family extracellular repeat protein